MAEYIGYVMERRGQRAKVRIDRNRSRGEHIPKFLDCWNACEAKVGMEVEVGIHQMNPKMEKFIMYGIPLLSAIAGGTFGRSVSMFFQWPVIPTIIGGTILWTYLGWSYIGSFRRDVAGRGEQWTVLGMFQEKSKEEKAEEHEEKVEAKAEEVKAEAKEEVKELDDKVAEMKEEVKEEE